ncbi:tRNA wybutosine-synthesizing protein 2 homolog isoform X2 [Babylonia areolata]|uniref:tRNA wybutosine-synthesizing protein 2 homolog isoform X2 n=1 Tax=Babylonia areolata TaxID=304850 RepID=UPI003FD54726
MESAVVVPCSKAQLARKLLEAQGLWDKTRKLQRHDSKTVLIPVNTADLSLLSQHLHESEDAISIVQTDLPPSKMERLMTPAQELWTAVEQMLDQCSSFASSRERLLKQVPTHWEKHGDLVLLPASAFASAEWDVLGQKLWLTVAKCTRASRVARQSVISADGFRSPQVSLLLGENAVVQHVDNAIRYEYDLTCCMFSAGNISEKLRIAKFDCKGETVIDLYAGASHVHACEWNPHAVAALRRNLELNCVDTRCTVHPGDNRQLKLRGVADRINLGLIPSSEEGWPVACRVLKPTGGMLHIHGNVNSQTAEGERHPVIQGTATGPAVSVRQESPEFSAAAKGAATEGGVKQERIRTDLNRKCAEVLSQMQASALKERSREVLSQMQAASLQETGVTPLEKIFQTNVIDTSNLSSLPSESVEGRNKFQTDSDLKMESEGKQLRGYTAERDSLVQRDQGMSALSTSCANSQSCPQKTEQYGDPFLSHQSKPPHIMCDPSLTEPILAAPCCEKNGQSQGSVIHPNTPERSDVAAHNRRYGLKIAAWQKWGEHVCRSLKTLLEKEQGGGWYVSVVHIENVKSYAPHVHHIVLDVHCTPLTSVDSGDCSGL